MFVMMRHKELLAFAPACFLFSSLLPTPARAQDAPAKAPSSVTRDLGQADAVGRVNPVGAALSGSLEHKHVLSYDEGSGYEKAYWQLGAGVMITPAYLEPAVHLELAPASFLVLRAEANLFGFFGANWGLVRFPSADSSFGNTPLQRAEAHAALGERAAGSAMLRVKLGPLIPRNETTVAYYHFSDNGPYVYESENDTLMATSDGIVVNRSQLLVEAWHAHRDATLLIGPSFEVTRTVTTALNRERVGAFAFFVPADAWGGLRRPRFYAMGGVNATDPNRTGQPYALLGFGVDIE